MSIRSAISTKNVHMTKKLTFTTSGYMSPSVKIIEVKSQHVLCQSINMTFGDEGDAGGDMGSNDYPTSF